MIKGTSNVHAQQQSMQKRDAAEHTHTGWVAWYGFAVEFAPMFPATNLPLAEDATGAVVCLRAINRQSAAKQLMLAKHALAGSCITSSAARCCCLMCSEPIMLRIGQPKAKKTRHTKKNTSVRVRMVRGRAVDIAMVDYPGSDKGVKNLRKQPYLGMGALGDQLQSPGERAVAKDTRLLYEGAHESHVTATMMEERLETGSLLMEQTLELMATAAVHKSRFKHAVYKIRDLVKTNPDFGRELREVLDPVRAIIRTYEDDIREDDKYESSLPCLHDGDGQAASAGGGDAGNARAVGGKFKQETEHVVSNSRQR